MAAPAVIELVTQKGGGDCVIASLSMILAIPYNEVSKKALTLFEKPHSTGLSVRDTQRLSKALVGRLLQSVDAAKIDLDDETGILFVKLPGDYHAVALFEGSIFNPADGLLWNRHAYLATKKAHVVRLLRP